MIDKIFLTARWQAFVTLSDTLMRSFLGATKFNRNLCAGHYAANFWRLNNAIVDTDKEVESKKGDTTGRHKQLQAAFTLMMLHNRCAPPMC